MLHRAAAVSLVAEVPKAVEAEMAMGTEAAAMAMAAWDVAAGMKGVVAATRVEVGVGAKGVRGKVVRAGTVVVVMEAVVRLEATVAATMEAVVREEHTVVVAVAVAVAAAAAVVVVAELTAVKAMDSTALVVERVVEEGVEEGVEEEAEEEAEEVEKMVKLGVVDVERLVAATGLLLAVVVEAVVVMMEACRALGSTEMEACRALGRTEVVADAAMA